MRIAYIHADTGIPFHGPKGGSVHVRCITEALAELGHEVTCYTPRPGEATGEVSPVTLRTVAPDAFSVKLAARLGSAARDAARQKLRTRETAALCLNAAIERLVEADHVERPFDFLMERYSLWSFAGARLSSRLGLPLLLEVNALLPEEQRRFRSLGLGAVADAIRHEVFRQAACVVAVSRTLAAQVVSEGIDPGRVVVVPNGYQSRLLDAVEPSRPADGLFRVGFLGSLKPWHGVDLLCDAFARLAADRPEARLLLVGEGPMRGWVEEFSRRHGLTHRIRLTGPVSHEQIAAHLASMDVAVAPYPAMDNFYFSPLKMFEYMGSGRAIVASRIGQIDDVLIHGNTAWLVPPGDVDGLVAGLVLLADHPDLGRRLGTAAAEQARSRYRWADVARRLIEVVTDLCQVPARQHA